MTPETHKWGTHDFSLEVVAKKIRCSECERDVLPGGMMWVSRSPKNSRYLRKGMVGKRVCSVECGQTFDYREMRARALLRERGHLR